MAQPMRRRNIPGTLSWHALALLTGEPPNGVRRSRALGQSSERYVGCTSCIAPDTASRRSHLHARCRARTQRCTRRQS